MNARISLSLLTLAALLVLLGLAPRVEAQFHQKDEQGKTQVNQQLRQPAAQPARPAPVRRPGDGPVIGRGDQNASIMETEFARDPANKGLKIGLGLMSGQPASNWSRSTVHSDGSYTVTKVDSETELASMSQGNLTLVQVTKSARGQELWERIINLNEVGNPTDVLIYVGRRNNVRGELRYRGEFIYNRMGIFQEEILLDIEGNVLRRTIQPYDQNGKQLPEKEILYTKQLPQGLQVIVTDDETQALGSTTEKIGWLTARKERKEMERQAQAQQDASPYGGFGEAGAPEKPKREGFLKKMFGKDK